MAYDEYISDESSFYGDDDEKARLHDLVDAMVSHHQSLSTAAPSLTRLAEQNLASAAAAAASQPRKPPLFNPHEGLVKARQLGESGAAFVERLPPSSTPQAELGPWLWCANPHAATRPTDADVAGYVRAAQAVLDELGRARAALEAGLPEGTAAAVVTRKYAPVRQAAETALVEAARRHGVMAGKWMLFPPTGRVDEVWREVVEGTIAGEFGVDAKVATDDGGDARKSRLVCVYTRDFTDVEDVTRVIKALHERGLGRGGLGIYYKCDAYTYVDIKSGNKWGIKASSYGSRDLLKLSRAK